MTTKLLTARGILAIGFLMLTAVSCSNQRNNADNKDSTISTTDTIAENTSPMKAHADINATKSDTTGSGSAHFTKKDDGTVELTLQVSFPQMANKSVAVHLHEHGDCSDAGKGAHGHWNPTNEAHGKWNSTAFHSGDIGNVSLNEKGEGSITLSSNRWSIGGDEKTNILTRSVIVHSGVDDYTSQPSGNAGSRIGCGLIAAN
ncbi:superoxide dismutase family protein [Flavihumibacter sp. R14]|nr:superoxide dismutase family protein [Flavihumibacter soli]